ncbi:small integral membrane protein 30-like [Acipenser ruthenus]|uniref:small integral membrane protein 30-like n=1 Tax=Acipenser ruthenus TaxID=7906 RepID=UPI00145A75E0|nr:small integral membrane protein 30-like [Acipenser ruthenus]
MASRSDFFGSPLLLGFFILSLLPTAEAFDGGDAVALLLGMTISVVGFCACLGWYSRKRNGQL